jgi:hypothetical protein
MAARDPQRLTRSNTIAERLARKRFGFRLQLAVAQSSVVTDNWRTVRPAIRADPIHLTDDPQYRDRGGRSEQS